MHRSTPNALLFFVLNAHSQFFQWSKPPPNLQSPYPINFVISSRRSCRSSSLILSDKLGMRVLASSAVSQQRDPIFFNVNLMLWLSRRDFCKIADRRKWRMRFAYLTVPFHTWQGLGGHSATAQQLRHSPLSWTARNDPDSLESWLDSYQHINMH